MNEREALKLALEALEEAWYHVGTFQPTEKAIDLYDEARAAIKEVLAQPEQEPVAWITQGGKGWLRWHKPEDNNTDSVPLYTTPPQRTWVGLTDEDLAGCDEAEYKAARYWETTLKEKNT